MAVKIETLRDLAAKRMSARQMADELGVSESWIYEVIKKHAQKNPAEAIAPHKPTAWLENFEARYGAPAETMLAEMAANAKAERMSMAAAARQLKACQDTLRRALNALGIVWPRIASMKMVNGVPVRVSTKHMATINGETMPVADWCLRYRLSTSSVNRDINAGIPPEQSIMRRASAPGRSLKMIEYNGKLDTAAWHCRDAGIKPNLVLKLMRDGLSFERALEQAKAVETAKPCQKNRRVKRTADPINQYEQLREAKALAEAKARRKLAQARA